MDGWLDTQKQNGMEKWLKMADAWAWQHVENSVNGCLYMNQTDKQQATGTHHPDKPDLNPIYEYIYIPFGTWFLVCPMCLYYYYCYSDYRFTFDHTLKGAVIIHVLPKPLCCFTVSSCNVAAPCSKTNINLPTRKLSSKTASSHWGPKVFWWQLVGEQRHGRLLAQRWERRLWWRRMAAEESRLKGCWGRQGWAEMPNSRWNILRLFFPYFDLSCTDIHACMQTHSLERTFLYQTAHFFSINLFNLFMFFSQGHMSEQKEIWNSTHFMPAFYNLTADKIKIPISWWNSHQLFHVPVCELAAVVVF